MSAGSPDEIAYSAASEAEEITGRDADGLVEKAKRDQAAVDTLIGGLVAAIDAGASRDLCEKLIDNFADDNRTVTKTELMERFEDGNASEMGADSESGPAKMTSQLIKDECALRATETTDHDQDTQYQWDFGDYQVTSVGNGGQGRYHLSEYQFRTEILSARGADGRIPRATGWESDEWLAFISNFIHENARKSTVEGPLTLSAIDISNYIENHTAYAPIEVLQAYEGVFVPQGDGPTDGDETEVWVSGDVIVDIADKYNVESMSKLAAELDARDALSDRLDSASERLSVAGNRQSYWVFDRAFAEPMDYIVNPADLDDPAEYTDGSIDPLSDDDESDDETDEDEEPTGNDIDYDAFDEDDGGEDA